MAGIPNWNRFDEVSDSYDDHFLTSREPARRLVEFVAVDRGAKVLEVGCGTGFATFLIAQAVGGDGSVLATDIADKMIDVARAKAQKRSISNVEFRTANGSDLLDLGDGVFDLVLANCVLMGFSDVPGALNEWARVVRPGGTVAFSSFSRDAGPPSLPPETLQVFEKYIGDVPRFQFPPSEIDTTGKCADQLKQAGLTDIEVEQLDLGYHYREFDVFWNEWWSSLFRLRLQALDPAELDAMRAELRRTLREVLAGDGMFRPNITILARARR